jgi:hypothetical protein
MTLARQGAVSSLRRRSWGLASLRRSTVAPMERYAARPDSRHRSRGLVNDQISTTLVHTTLAVEGLGVDLVGTAGEGVAIISIVGDSGIRALSGRLSRLHDAEVVRLKTAAGAMRDAAASGESFPGERAFAEAAEHAATSQNGSAVEHAATSHNKSASAVAAAASFYGRHGANDGKRHDTRDEDGFE